MRKKMMAAALSVAVCTAMFGTTCFAAGGDMTNTAGSTITGDSEVKSPIYSVVVPTTVEFGIDAFEQAGQTNSQIASAELPIYNKSNVAVRVQADVKVEPATGVTLVDEASKVTETDTSKNLYIGLEIPKTVALTLDTAADATGTDATAIGDYTKHSDGKFYLTAGLTTEEKGSGGDFDGEGAAAAADIKAQAIKSNTITYPAGTDADPQYIITLSETPVSVAFALDKADYYKVYSKSSDTSGVDKFYKAASASDGATAFRLTGAVNSRAAWAANDVKASITYTFLGIRGANYATQTADAATDNPNIAYVDNTAKLLLESSAPTFTTSDDTLGVVTYTEGTGDDALATITSVKWEYNGAQSEQLGVNITHDTTAKSLAISSTGLNYWSNVASTKTATVSYTTVGGDSKSVDITFKLTE